MHVLLSTTAFPAQDHYRITEPARAVNEADLGVTATVRRGLETTVAADPHSGAPVTVDVEDHGADVVVMQLPMTDGMLQCMRLLQARGIAVVVEMDDLLSAVPVDSPAHRNMTRGGMARRALACAREADLVTVTTPTLLKEYAPHGRGMVIPNTIPRRFAELPPAYEREPETVVIGWTGSAPSRPYDLRIVGSGLQQALDRTAGRSRFSILGQAETAQASLGLREEPAGLPWVTSVEEYTTLLGTSFDVGIVPLRSDRFNNAKSWLKVVEYAARGVYLVHSPHPEYDLLGIGRRARAPREWARHLTTAVDDPAHRREVAEQNRQVVMENLLTEHVAQWWVDAWDRARDNRARAMRIGA
ncbi:glycosyltransferase [Modestobacter sp. I12A-02628]|uniref:Glycosyltransferase family 4 protein n=1 Tax=Goekera deserti TaxID=2497753 RepID=A0A7K3WCM1_9ACTN|nr:glycosyltransferase [Goekera deserti]MPQ99510.1 glycosyltransferase [Goekera deserti]NDI48997.1 glycosyltransferase [Goekera deserti]NEL54212.1 glycosyltransferase family 4 protein [Goekera deserti]